MKTAAIVTNNWKLPIYKRHLDEYKYTYTVVPSELPDISIIKVAYDWAYKLVHVIKAATEECKNAN